jgi:hypothetical protein
MTDSATLITQLRVLAHLTRTEAQVARLRIPQASADDVREELRRNADDADRRAQRIADVLRELGALPDPVTPVLGRVAALVRGAVEQAQPLDEALLADLALEHQLRDRARYVGALADAAGLPAVRTLADDLDAAHAETVHWLDGVLADLAGGHRAALDATPLQRVAAQVARAANTPRRATLDEAGATVSHTVSRVVDTVLEAGGEVRTAVEEYASRAAEGGGEAAGAAVAAGQNALAAGRETAGRVADTATHAAGAAVAAGQDALTAGRDAAARAADAAVTTGRDTATQTVGAATQAAGELARRVTGTGQPDEADTDTSTSDPLPPVAPSAPDEETGPTTGAEPPTPENRPLPLPDFAELPPHAAIAALRTLDDPDDLAALLAFEQAHGNRPSVVAAARVRADAVRSRT